jgi:hypothetical protein
VSDYPLTVADFRALVTTAATDDAIQLALNNAYEAIQDAAGPLGDTTERFVGGFSSVMLGQRAQLIVSVLERIGSERIELATDDYELSATGGSVRRLIGGTNPSRYWRGQVVVQYTPYLGVETRKAVQAELVGLDIGASVGAAAGALASQRIGEFSETFATTAIAQSPEDRRESILERLNPPGLVYWTASGRSPVPDPAGS